MREYREVIREEHPSSTLIPHEKKEPFILPQDPDAEKMMKIEGLVTDELVDYAFQGIDLVTYDGKPFSRTFLVSSMNSAIDLAEQTFDICIAPREIKNELHDFEGGGAYDMYQYTPLYKRPVKRVTKFAYRMGNREVFTVPNEWLQIDKRVGDVTIFPVGGTAQVIVPQSGYAFPFYARNYLPMAISIDYVAGMDKEELPANLLEWIFKMAAINIFEVWGDQIIGAGIASSSISLDGLSQSIGTTQSAMYGGASARILEYRKDVDNLTNALRKYFARFESVVL